MIRQETFAEVAASPHDAQAPDEEPDAIAADSTTQQPSNDAAMSDPAFETSRLDDTFLPDPSSPLDPEATGPASSATGEPAEDLAGPVREAWSGRTPSGIFARQADLGLLPAEPSAGDPELPAEGSHFGAAPQPLSPHPAPVEPTPPLEPRPAGESRWPPAQTAARVEVADTVMADPDDPEAFGRWLRRQREMRGIRLRAIADTSKISLAYLEALENGRFEILPADVFTRGFLRQYARFVGLDPEEAVNFYLVAKDRADDDGEGTVAEVRTAAGSGHQWVLVALILTDLLLGGVWLLARAGSADEGGEADPGVQSGEMTRGPEAPPLPAEEPATDPTSDTTADAATPTASVEMPAEAEGPPSVVEELPASTAPVRVVLDFTDTCWVSATVDSGGTQEKMHAQGESLILEAQRVIDLKVGNHRAVEVEVNGMPYDLAGLGRGGFVRSVRIDEATVRDLVSGRSATPPSPRSAAQG